MSSLFDVTAGSLIGPTTGGTVTQATNKGTGVTLNTQSGQITMNNAALADAAEVSFTVTNSKIAATDVKLNSYCVKMKKPIVNNTSCIIAIIAAILYL